MNELISVRTYGENGFAYADDSCACGEGGVMVIPSRDGAICAVEQHVAGCEDDDLPARCLHWAAGKVIALEADNAARRARVEALEKALVGAYRQGEMPNDAACARCSPYSEILIDGFACWWHQGEALARRGREAVEEKPRVIVHESGAFPKEADSSGNGVEEG